MDDEKESNWWQSGSLLLQSVVPMIGAVSYQAFGMHICNPSLITRLLAPQSAQRVITGLNLNTAIGSAVYLYYRPHIRILPPSRRILFSAFVSTAFNFGSFFAWIMLRDLFHEDEKKAVLALVTSTSLLLIASAYARHVDSLVPGSESA